MLTVERLKNRQIIVIDSDPMPNPKWVRGLNPGVVYYIAYSVTMVVGHRAKKIVTVASNTGLTFSDAMKQASKLR